MLKNILIGIGILAIVIFISFLVIGVKVVSTVAVYIVGFIAIIFFIGYMIYLFGRSSGKNKD
ncbi:MAG: hypothetical protein LIP08_00400 [Bacteroides sp.]|nr:hypothetical protein [Bacteroides sp.]